MAMSPITFDANSSIIRVRLLNSSSTTGAGLTGLTSASTGLIISTIADNEASATTYTVAGSTIETIAALGTYAAPTATKCRFKEVDATNHPGLYELQFADARFSVASAKKLYISLLGATNLVQTQGVIPLPVATLGGQINGLLRISKAGELTAYAPSADTDAARGTAALSAFTAMAQHDLLLIGPGIFELAANVLTQLPADCRVIGAGMMTTRITSTKAGNFGAIFPPGNRCYVSDLAVIGTSTTSQQSPFGLNFGTNAVATDILVERCWFEALDDAIHLTGATTDPGVVKMTFKNCRCRSTWDSVAIVKALIGTTWMPTIDVIDCDLQSIGPRALGATYVRAVYAEAGTIRVWRTPMIARNSGSNGSEFTAAGATTQYGSIELYGCHLDATNTGTAGAYHLHHNSTGTIRVQDTPYTVSATSGTITLITPAGLLEPTVAGRTLDVTATGAAAIDWGNVENKTTTNALTATTISTASSPTLAEITAAIAQANKIIVTSPIEGSEMTVVKGDAYTVAEGTHIVLAKETGETGWPTTITTIHFSAAPDTVLQAEASILATSGIDDVALTSVTNSGGSLALTVTETALTLTTKQGRYRFWFIANKATFPKTIRTGTMRVVAGDTN